MLLLLRAVRYALLLCLLLPAGQLRAQLPTGPAAATPVQPGRLVFRLKPELRHLATATAVADPTLLAALRRIGATQLHQKFQNTLLPDPEKPESVDISLIYEILLPTPTDLTRAQQLLLATGTVLYAEPLYYRAPLAQPNDPLADSTRADGQYYLRNIRAYSAWGVTQGDTTVVIGIADTGTRFTHEDLGQVKYNYSDPIDGIDNDHDGYVDNFRGWDLADNDNNPDSNPLIGQSKHGILVAGAAAGTPNNGKGIAGVGYYCRYLPLKIYSSTNQGRFAGYEAVVYAADHGCQVLNLSWGGAGNRSQFEQDVITYAAVNRDMVIVAAAGNTNAELDFYPASYDHVLSVAGTQSDNVKAPPLTYSRRVDLCAPGADILTTWGDYTDGYTRVGGSSFASPIVAGAAALVRSRFPTYSAAQVIAQLRGTANSTIYTLPGNAPYVGKLGTGLLDAYRAVVATDVRAVQVVRNQLLSTTTPNQAQLEIEVQNLLLSVTNLRVTIASLSPYLTTNAEAFAVPALPTLGRAINSAVPFRLTIAPNTPLNTKVLLECRLTADNGYRATQYLTVVLNPGYVVLSANDLHITLNSQGNLGYDSPASGIGESITYRQSSPLLYEGGLVVATSPTRVSSRVRGAKGTDQDFRLLRQTMLIPPTRANQEAQGIFQDSLPSLTRNRTVGVRVRQHAYAWADEPDHQYVLLQYQLTNVTPDTLKPLYAGLFMDWDLPTDPAHNVALWDANRALGYVYSLTIPDLYMGVQVLAGGLPAYYALSNSTAATGPVSAANGLSQAEKFAGLSNGTTYASAGLPYGDDVSQLVGAALRALPPGDSTTLTLAILGAPSLPALQAAADAARQRFAQVLPTRAAVATTSWQVYPNPTAGQLRVEIPASFAPVEIRLLNQVGAVVLQQATTAHVALDVHAYPAGLYVLQIRLQDGSTLTRQVVVQP